LVQAAADGLLTRLDELAINVRLLGFAIGVSMLSGLLAGFLPAVRLARTDVARNLRAYASGPRAASRVPTVSRFVVAQVASAVVLLIVGSLLARDFARVASVKTGFDPAGVLAADIALSPTRYSGGSAMALFDRVLAGAHGLPNVKNAALVNPLPGSYVAFGLTAEVEGCRQSVVNTRIVSPEYFSVLSVPVLAGRFFSDTDTAAASQVVVVNEAFARHCWGGVGQALGKHITPSGSRVAPSAPDPRLVGYTVIGVTASLREHGGLALEHPEVYWTLHQTPGFMRSNPLRQLYLLLRARDGNAATLAAPLRQLVRAIDPHLPLYNVQPLERFMSTKVARQRLLVVMMVVFGALTLVLAAVGVYGVMAYAVAMHTHEFAVRLALGSTPRGVLALVLRRRPRLVALGVAIGVPTALVCTWFSSAEIFAVTETDPLTCALAVLLVVVTGTIASVVPAWRAARVEPSLALRDE
jgi:putative ABC transport system permease protein